MGYAPESASWQELLNRVGPLVACGIPRMFESDPKRGLHYQCRAADLVMDYSRQLVDDHTLQGLLELAQIVDVPAAIHGMFAGK